MCKIWRFGSGRLIPPPIVDLMQETPLLVCTRDAICHPTPTAVMWNISMQQMVGTGHAAIHFREILVRGLATMGPSRTTRYLQRYVKRGASNKRYTECTLQRITTCWMSTRSRQVRTRHNGKCFSGARACRDTTRHLVCLRARLCVCACLHVCELGAYHEDRAIDHAIYYSADISVTMHVLQSTNDNAQDQVPHYVLTPPRVSGHGPTAQPKMGREATHRPRTRIALRHGVGPSLWFRIKFFPSMWSKYMARINPPAARRTMARIVRGIVPRDKGWEGSLQGTTGRSEGEIGSR
jgi:hypothetical protein